MKHRPHARPSRTVPLFHPVPTRGRRDGWTPLRQAQFLGQLLLTRSVSAAARAVGMARETAYRLRRRPGADSFARAWDRVLGHRQEQTGQARKVTVPGAWDRVSNGRLRPVLYRGRLVAVVRKPDNSAILALIARHDRAIEALERVLGGAGGAADTNYPLACKLPLPFAYHSSHIAF